MARKKQTCPLSTHPQVPPRPCSANICHAQGWCCVPMSNTPAPPSGAPARHARTRLTRHHPRRELPSTHLSPYGLPLVFSPWQNLPRAPGTVLTSSVPCLLPPPPPLILPSTGPGRKYVQLHRRGRNRWNGRYYFSEDKRGLTRVLAEECKGEGGHRGLVQGRGGQGGGKELRVHAPHLSSRHHTATSQLIVRGNHI